MTEAEARFEIGVSACATQYPKLTMDQLTLLVKKARVADKFTRAPSDPAWTPTWDIARVVALGWQMKAANANAGDEENAPAYDIKAGDELHHRSQIVKHCLEQAEIWKRKCGLGSQQLVGQNPLELSYYLGIDIADDQVP